MTDSGLSYTAPPNGTKSNHFFSLYDALNALCKEKKIVLTPPIPYIDYIPPKLVAGKVWYVSYSCKNPATGKMQRVRIKINRVPSSTERRLVGRKLVAEIGVKLQMGWNPFAERVAPKASARMFETLDRFLSVKTKDCRCDTMRGYISYVKLFKSWLTERGYDESSYVGSFTENDAIDFMDDRNLVVSARTFNNSILFFKVLFNWMVEHKYIKDNPFMAVKRKPKRLTHKVRRLFTPDEFSALMSWLESNNIPYLVMTLMCYCCFIRPKELSMLRCRDIDLDNQLVRISASIAKNEKDSVRTIPDSMMRYVRLLDLSNPGYYIFGDHRKYDFSPGAKKASSRKFASYWSYVIRPALGFPKELQFYSLKDTGITNMVNSGVPLTSVQQQADHSSLAITSIYIGKTERASEALKAVDIID